MDEATATLASTANEYDTARRLTVGDYATEAEAERALTDAFYWIGHFDLDPQVTGHYLFTRPGCPSSTPRIDFVLHPSQEALDMGWHLGPVGIECKASGVKLGRPISQALDYSRAVFPSIRDRNTMIALSYVFLFPMAPQGGPLGSVLAQQRIGSLMFDRRGDLLFSSGQHAVACLSADYSRWRFWTDRTESMGRKVGSR